MTHLIVELYDRFGDKFPCCRLDDHDVSSRQYFHDLYQRGVADRVARVVVQPGDEYRTGDHIRLLDKVKPSHTDTIAIDPAVAGDVDLDDVLINEHGFAERAAAILFVTNPNVDSSYRLRLCLYSQVGQKIPSIVLYDWECTPGEYLADLNCFNFANRADFIRIEPGPGYQPGDRVVLREALAAGSRSYALEPGEYDLTRFMVEERTEVGQPLIHTRKLWADMMAAIEFELQPTIVWN